jgi:hypothetical protein
LQNLSQPPSHRRPKKEKEKEENLYSSGSCFYNPLPALIPFISKSHAKYLIHKEQPQERRKSNPHK